MTPNNVPVPVPVPDSPALRSIWPASKMLGSDSRIQISGFCPSTAPREGGLTPFPPISGTGTGTGTGTLMVGDRFGMEIGTLR
jgi:hypothetical protein